MEKSDRVTKSLNCNLDSVMMPHTDVTATGSHIHATHAEATISFIVNTTSNIPSHLKNELNPVYKYEHYKLNSPLSLGSSDNALSRCSCKKIYKF